MLRLLALLTLLALAQSTVLTRVVLTDPAAVCLDGSPYSYYVSVGTNATKFYVYFQGGGW